MERNAPTSEQRQRSTSARDRVAAPLEVFYVVQTTGGAGDRHHCVRSALYETRPQAWAELVHLRAANAGGTYSIWKGTTYVEPAEWRYDVVLADGSVIRPGLAQ